MEKTYVQTYVPDKDRLADLLVRARGRDRFMADFARECGCSPASFTRITKKLITRPLNDALIEEIAKNAAPDSGVDLDMLMRANGKLPEGEKPGERPAGKMSELDRLKNERAYLHTSAAVEEETLSIVTEELYARGLTIGVYRRFAAARGILGLEPSRYHLPTDSSFCIKLVGYEPDLWNFITAEHEMIKKADNGTEERLIAAYKISAFSGLFLRDVWEPEYLKRIKSSFTFFDRENFEKYRELLGDKQFNSCMSLILLDREKKFFVEEQMLGRAGGREDKSLFELERIELEEEEDM